MKITHMERGWSGVVIEIDALIAEYMYALLSRVDNCGDAPDSASASSLCGN